MIALLILVCCSVTNDKFCRCDLIEFNTVQREDCPSFQQVIFWRWNHRTGRYDARGWVAADHVELLDTRRVKAKGWTVSGTIRFTLTDYDPERHNLTLCPDSERVLMPWGR